MSVKKINNTPKIIWQSIETIDEKRDVIVLTSPSAEKITQSFLKKISVTTKLHIGASDFNQAEKLAKDKPNGEVVYAIGGGGVIDVARYLASKWHLDIICIPTIISSDAFLVDCTGLRKNGCVTYVPSKRADLVILDYSILNQAKTVYNLSGCCDVLSIYTGLEDWRYANQKGKAQVDEVFIPAIAHIATSILESLFEEKEEIKKMSRRGLEAVVTALSMEVLLCNLYGNSRPEEGGEHFFAYCIENYLPHFLHGEMVGFGILLTAFIQKQNWKKMQQFMDFVGYQYRTQTLTKEVVIAVLKELPVYVKKNKLRYSIYNDFVYEEHQERLEHFFVAVGLQ